MAQTLTSEDIAAITAAVSAVSGSVAVSVTFKDANAVVVPYVRYTVTGKGNGTTTVLGVGSFSLDPGTYTLTAAPEGRTLFPPQTLTVVAGTPLAVVVTGTAATIPISDPGSVTVWGLCLSSAGVPQSGVVVKLRLVKAASVIGSSAEREATSGADGIVAFANHPQNSTAFIYRGDSEENKQKVVATTSDVQVGDLVGKP